MSIKKLSFMLLSALSLAALMNGCGSSSKDGTSNLGGVAKVDEATTCRVCHASSPDPLSGQPILADYLASPHNTDNAGCQGCHGGGAQHNGVGPIPFPNPLASDRCKECHSKAPAVSAATNFVGDCAHCHTSSGSGSVHATRVASTLPNANDCVGCHDVAAPQHGADRVGDNNGVRAIVGEFSKWSHHVTGVNLQNAHCAACHLEGTVQDGRIVINTTYHMADNITHLRNADTDADMQWDPAAPNHSTMDNFCMSCHDADGATSTQSAAIRALMVPAAGKTASASNPFGDTISNRYDKMQRPAVVDAKDQFDPANNSHHAVRGKRYSGRSRVAGPRQIASAATFASNSSATLYGKRSTIYDAGNLNALYSPLGTDGTDATGLGDDSTLHCGDCHTVGQWKVGSSDTANGSPTPVAIGAHGSNNEYLLRNTLGTDARHTQNAYTLDAFNNVTYTNPNGAFLVCYNCHSYTKYGSIYLNSGALGSHAGEYDVQGRCNGIGNTLPFGGYTTGSATDGTQFGITGTQINNTRISGKPGVNSNAASYLGEQNTGPSNIFGIQCLDCHNSGIGNAYGGIHGSAKNQQTTPATVITGATVPAGGYYIDGMGNATKIERFLPGLGNAMYVPGSLGGFSGGASKTVGAYTFISGGVSNDSNWEQKVGSQTGSVGAGCYTLDKLPVTATTATNALNGSGPSVTGAGGAATNVLGTWGGCNDHNSAQGAGTSQNKRIVRPVTY